MISWTVVGHTARAIHAASLARNLKAQLVMDDGTLGADANHLRAWAIEPHPNANWVGVLEDDAQPVAGFAEQVDVALAAAPTDIVSLYLGTGRPLRWQERMAHATDQSDEDGAHWITSTHLLHAVAAAIRSELRDDWLSFAHRNTQPIDERMSAWCRARGHLVSYTSPSLVDHRDGPTLVSHRDDTPRRAWRTGTHETWNSKAVSL